MKNCEKKIQKVAFKIEKKISKKFLMLEE